MLCTVKNLYSGEKELVFMPRGYENDEKYVVSLLEGWKLELVEVLCGKRCKDSKDGCLSTVEVSDKFRQMVPVCVCEKMQRIVNGEGRNLIEEIKTTALKGLSESLAY